MGEGVEIVAVSIFQLDVWMEIEWTIWRLLSRWRLGHAFYMRLGGLEPRTQRMPVVHSGALGACAVLCPLLLMRERLD